MLGVFLNSILMNICLGFQNVLTSVGGLVIIGFGAYLILSTRLRCLNFEKKFSSIPKFKTSYITSFVLECICSRLDSMCGSYLGQYAYIGGYAPSGLQFITGLLPRSRYSIFSNKLFLSQATIIIRKMVKHLKYFNPAMGIMLIILGILVFTNNLSILGNFHLPMRLLILKGEHKLNKDNISAVLTGVAVVALMQDLQFTLIVLN